MDAVFEPPWKGLRRTFSRRTWWSDSHLVYGNHLVELPCEFLTHDATWLITTQSWRCNVASCKLHRRSKTGAATCLLKGWVTHLFF